MSISRRVWLVSLLVVAFSAQATDWYVATNGVNTNPGTLAAPLDIDTAFGTINRSAPIIPPVLAGDTIWLRGGTYVSKANSATNDLRGSFTLLNNTNASQYSIVGTSNSPIIIRNYNNERAVLDGNLYVATKNLWFWGLEITDSEVLPVTITRAAGDAAISAGTYKAANLNLYGSGNKFINCIFHDCPQSASAKGDYNEIYGTLFIDNGRWSMDYSSGHGLYAQGSSPFSWTKVNDCVFANNALNGCQLYSALDANINNYQMTGNLFLRNGNGVPGGVEFVEGSGSGCTNLVFKNNVMLGNASDSATFGGSATLLVNADIEQNCFYNLPVNFYSFTGLTMLSNLVDNANSFLLVQSNYFGAVWDYNNYYFSSPTPVTMDFYPSGGAAYLTHAQWVAYSGFDVHSTVAATLTNPSVIVRSNQWEVGRGSITIVNPRSNGVVNVDLSGIGLAKGQTYVIHPVQDFFGYCLTNTYVGTPVAIPMTNWHCYTPMSLVNAITNQVWLTNVNGESIVNSNYSTMIPIVANGGLISTFPAFGAFVVVPIPLVLLAPPTALIIYTNKHVNP